MVKRAKAGGAQGAIAPADITGAAGGSAAPASSSVPAFLQAGQVCKLYMLSSVRALQTGPPMSREQLRETPSQC